MKVIEAALKITDTIKNALKKRNTTNNSISAGLYFSDDKAFIASDF